MGVVQCPNDPQSDGRPERNKLTRHAYEQLVAEDLAWLAKQPHTCERTHIEVIVKDSVEQHYGPCSANPRVEPRDWKAIAEAALLALETGENLATLRARFGLDCTDAGDGTCVVEHQQAETPCALPGGYQPRRAEPVHRPDYVKAATSFIDEWLPGDEEIVGPLAEELHDAYNAGHRVGSRTETPEPDVALHNALMRIEALNAELRTAQVDLGRANNARDSAEAAWRAPGTRGEVAFKKRVRDLCKAAIAYVEDDSGAHELAPPSTSSWARR